MKRGTVIFTLLVLSAILDGRDPSATSFSPNKGTRGIAAVCLYFDVLDETPVEDPWPELEKECRQQLEKAGVRTVDVDKCAASPSNASLFLSVMGAPGKSRKSWAFVVELELSQAVTLRRDPSQTLDAGAVTYSNRHVGLAGADHIASTVRGSALKLLEQFAEVYEAENRKP